MRIRKLKGWPPSRFQAAEVKEEYAPTLVESLQLLAASTQWVRIPMADGVDSLNVAAATAIACYALASR